MIVASIVSVAAVYDLHELLVPFLGVWCVIDCAPIYASSSPDAKRDSLLIHHALTAWCCVLFWFEGTKYDPKGTTPRRMCFFEVSTVFVCLYNVFPTRTLFILRNVVFAFVRSIISVWIIVGIVNEPSQRTRHVAPQVALVALSVAWMGGKTVVGRNASLVCYLTAFLSAVLKLNSGGHATFSVLGAMASYAFYEKNIAFFDRQIITSHVMFVACSSFIGESMRSIIFCLASSAVLHGWLKEKASRNVNNFLVPSLLFMIEREKMSPELVVGFVIMAMYLRTGGPKNLTYGHRVMWHCACTCVIAECMLSLPAEESETFGL